MVQPDPAAAPLPRPPRRRGLGAVARLGGALLLWGPILLWLTVLVPTTAADGSSRLDVHAGVALLLALIGSQILRQLFTLPEADPAKARFRVQPARPWRPFLMAAGGSGCMAWGLWSLWTGAGDLIALGALPSGLLAVWMASIMREDPAWGTWIEISGDALRIHCPRAEDWSIPLSKVVRVRLRSGDRSFLVETPWPERDVFVPSAAAPARYSISDHEALLGILTDRVPVEESPDLAPPPRLDRQA